MITLNVNGTPRKLDLANDMLLPWVNDRRPPGVSCLLQKGTLDA